MHDRLLAERWRSRVRLLAALAGFTDTVTGILLIAEPRLVLRLMGAEAPGGSLIFLRFVGAFVCGVGLSYFPPFLREGRALCDAAMRSTFATTAVIRLAIALFTGAAVASGALSTAWLSVTSTDLALAVLQGWIVRSGVLDAAE